MKRYLLFLSAALLMCCHVFGQQLTAAEYFFDTDPGVGNGTTLVITAGDTVDFSGSISAASLSTGFHNLYVRTQASNGAWSLRERRMFYVQSNTSSASLAAAEYFFDTEPGVGNGTPLVIIPGDTINFSGTISAIGLTAGFHFLYIRAKDANGIWSMRERRMFYISNSTTSSPQLTAAEYFFDTEPGVGNGTALTVVGGDSILFSGTISAGALPVGFHMLYIRTMDLNGTWGIRERRMVYVQPTAIAAAPILLEAEWFTNSPDPGFGNANALTVTAGDTIDFTGAITVTDTAIGCDSLYIRVKDQTGVWSLYEPRGFCIVPVSVKEIAGINGSLLFQNFPNPFSRSTRIDFYLQSTAEVMFYITDVIGKTIYIVNAGKQNPGRHTIEFNLANLEEGYYFYKMVAGDFTDTKQMVNLK
jgi:hypothetical protein